MGRLVGGCRGGILVSLALAWLRVEEWVEADEGVGEGKGVDDGDGPGTFLVRGNGYAGISKELSCGLTAGVSSSDSSSGSVSTVA
jgi:hypothetical protein